MRRAARAAGTGLIGGVLVLAAVLAAAPAAAAKPPLTFRKFFHAVSFAAVQVAPDGSAVVIETNRADYAHNRFRTDLWIYSIAGNGQGGELAPLATGGYAGSPQWSPNSRWVAFLSGRAGQGRQLYVIPARGGAAAMLSAIPGGVHAYSWGTDSRTLYFAAKTPLTAAQIAAHKQKWHDVIRYDRDLRGDSIYRVAVPAADAFNSEPPAKFGPGALGATLVAKVYYRVGQLLATNDGRHLIYDTRSRRGPIWVNGYQHKQIFAVTLAPRAGTPGGLAADPAATRWTRDRAIADRLRLPVAGGGLFFAASSNIPGPYSDLQGRIYYLSGALAGPERWAAAFPGSWRDYVPLAGGQLVADGHIHTEVQPYLVTAGGYQALPAWRGTYSKLSVGAHSPRLAFVYSAQTRPSEVYLAADWRRPDQARAITHFNDFLAATDLPTGRNFNWTADDGVQVQGRLIFPPGEAHAKHLPLFVLIHGGPEDADLNHWEADWYQWGSLAAADGWLVFEPNYRGSSGYGDAFMRAIVPHIVSRPGKDILEGVQALIHAGLVDPAHMAVGGYSYGGYMTDWLITQTTEFKAAVTGAGAIENTANWGNDDLYYDDTYWLGGLPWQNEAIYNSEAAIWQIYRVKTPTHIVMGAADLRVSTAEDHLLHRALATLGVPTQMLIFPGEHHGLGKNPWHGQIKVREELQWLRHYAWPAAGNTLARAGR